MKIYTVLLAGCFAGLLMAGCALPLGEDYLVNRDGSAGTTYITDYNLQTYVPIPKTGEKPVILVDNRGDLEVTVVWKDAAGTEIVPPFDTFLTNTMYQAEIKLSPRSGYYFYASVPFGYPEGKTRGHSDDLGQPVRTVTVAYNNSNDADITFITNYNLQSYVPIPLAGETPTDTLPGRADVTVAVAWKVEEEDPPNPSRFVSISGVNYTFEEGKVYQAEITLTANEGYGFIEGSNFKYPDGTVTIPPDDNNEVKIRKLTVTYMETGKPTVISEFNLTPYISKPIRGIMPVVSFAGSQYTGRVTWKNSGTQAVLVGPFQPDTEYMAEVSLSPAVGHTFTGVGQNKFIHTGAKTITSPAASGEVRIDFLSTGGGGGPTTVYDTDLTGRIPKPVSGEAPVLSVSGTQYTGSVTWAPPVYGTFQYGTVYTAVAALNAGPGYTFIGLGQNEFTHRQAPGGITNPAGNGTITMVFPATASSTLATITSFGPVTKADSALKLIKEKKADNSVTIDLSGGEEEEVEGGSVVLEAGKNSPAKVIINGRGRVLKISDQGTLLTVGGGVTLTLRNITLMGMSGNNAPLVRVQGGKLILGAGVILTGNENTGDAGGVWVNGGELVLYNGGVIKGMKAARGGGVLIDNGGQFTMGGGILGGEDITDGNRVTGENGGGGVLVADGTFDMLGGTIQYNSAEDGNSGGGVLLADGGIFDMHAGFIQSNRVEAGGSGGGVLVVSGAFSMFGGTVQSNEAFAGGSGGGVSILSQGTFNLYDGTIRGNKGLGSGSGGGVFLSGSPAYGGRGRFNMYSGTIGGGNSADANEAAAGGGGVYAIDADFILSGGTIMGNTGYGVYVHASDERYISVPESFYPTSYDSFLMRGAAQVHENNPVFLSSHATITIGETLTASTAANIIRQSTPDSATRLLRASSSELITANYDKFLYNGNGSHINPVASVHMDSYSRTICWFGLYQEY
ncbi:MAG: carbohydrate-binding domain-containing protein [Spirochaetaceae bacterium]|jgi:hypothetical protein|nr:carbohydrate-binding domain-containing protein [Spirochaetaceae bacterium]